MTNVDPPDSSPHASTAQVALTTQNEITRNEIVTSSNLTGRAFCHELSHATDHWITSLVAAAVAQSERVPTFALIAVGGYGRGELAPFSDIDLLLVHESSAAKVEAFASAIWYPIWDAGVKLGHAVRTVDEHLSLTKTDLDTATSMLTARQIAGDPALGERVIARGRALWTKRSTRWLTELRERARQRQEAGGDVAYVLEPDLKNGHGGVRDAQSLWWAECGGLVLPAADDAALNDCYDVLLGARVALQRSTGRPGDVLRLEDQDNAAVVAGHATADDLMGEIAAAARTVAWIADEAWARFGTSPSGAPTQVAPGVLLIDGEMELSADANPAVDPTYMLRVATAAARRGARIGRGTLDRLTELVPDWPERWPVGAIDDLVALLLEGHRAIPVIESFDQRGLITRMLPVWAPVRSRPQRNAYHRFTVDRHLLETAANAAGLADMVSRPDLLVLGALFHDIGKGYPGDHTEVGMEIVAELAPRLGLNAYDTETLVVMVQHHLLLPDAAVRRDLSDPATIEYVAAEVGTQERLELLHALTIADSIATGSSAWGPWKDELVADLAKRVAHVLGGGAIADATWTLFPNADTLAMMATGAEHISPDGGTITVVYRDLPGTFSRIAGVLSLHGLDVITARAHSDEPQLGRVSMGASEFRVEVPKAGIDWGPVEADLNRALLGQFAIEPRLAERARTYRRRRATQAAEPATPSVTFHDSASSNATVVEVRCPSRIGILYRITRALASVGLDIRHATVQTVGLDVVDTFYVRDWQNQLVTDPSHRAEVERAVLFAIVNG